MAHQSSSKPFPCTACLQMFRQEGTCSSNIGLLCLDHRGTSVSGKWEKLAASRLLLLMMPLRPLGTFGNRKQGCPGVCSLTLSRWKRLRSREPLERQTDVFTIWTPHEVSQCGVSGIFLKVRICMGSVSLRAGEGGRAWLYFLSPGGV